MQVAGPCMVSTHCWSWCWCSSYRYHFLGTVSGSVESIETDIAIDHSWEFLESLAIQSCRSCQLSYWYATCFDVVVTCDIDIPSSIFKSHWEQFATRCCLCSSFESLITRLGLYPLLGHLANFLDQIDEASETYEWRYGACYHTCARISKIEVLVDWHMR